MKLVNLALAGWTILVLLFLYGPIAVLATNSINKSVSGSEWKGATTLWYQVLWHGSVLEIKKQFFGGRGAESSEQALATIRNDLPRSDRRITSSAGPIIKSMFNSLLVAFVATAAATVLGTVAAWMLFRFNYPLSRALNTLIAVPMIVPEIIMGISLLILFATINWGLGFSTVIIGHITFCFPYVMITVQARLAGLDPSLEEAAMDLGATPLVAFWKVIVPYLFPAIISGALMAFTLSMDDFVVTYFTRGPDTDTFPLRVYGSVRVPNPLVSTVSTVLVLMTVVLVVSSELLKRRNAA